MTRQRLQTTHTRRDSWVEVNLSHIEHNCQQVRRLVGKDVKIMAVVKADAYGHGADMVAPVMQASGIDCFGVASIDEGIHLRQCAIHKDILVLGPPPLWALESALEHNIAMTIFSDEHALACQAIAKEHNKKFPVHVKVDIGMHRIGISVEQAVDFISRVQQMECLDLRGIFAHLPCAEHEPTSLQELAVFEELLRYIRREDVLIHVANSMTTLKYHHACYDMVRVGILLYGLYPDGQDEGLNLREAMALRGRITNLCTVKKGEGVSYGHTFVSEAQTMTIATIPVGYADGVSRSLSNKIHGILGRAVVPQVGNITMDQMMFDVSGMTHAKIGTVITLLGAEGTLAVSIEDWAKKLGTINYEITCRLKVRLPRVYVR